jgi:probable F420-dependent oxidoreductase
VRSGYANIPGKPHSPTWREGYWEPFTVLSHLAARTSRVLLGTSIIVLPMHNPFEIAKQVAEVDQLSQGRFVFGIGVGWFEEEFEVLGQDYHNRGARTDEALRLMGALWGEDPVTFPGRHYRVENAWFSPKPVQRPRPPIWVAGNGPPAIRRVARYGDCWHPVRPTYERVEQARGELAAAVEAAGRPPGSVGIAVKVPIVFQDGPPGEGQYPTEGRPADIVAALRRWQELGSEHIVLDLVPETLAVGLDAMERFAQEVRPKL